MNYEEPKALKVGDKVIWQDDPMDIGEVVALTESGVEINWPNVNQCAVISRYGLHDVSFPNEPMAIVREMAHAKSSY